MGVRRRQYQATTAPLPPVSVFTPGAWFDAPPVDRPKPSRRPPDEPTWNQTALAFVGAAWFEAPPEARARPWRRPPQEPTWDQAPLAFVAAPWFESSEAARPRQPHKPFYEDHTWNQTLIAPALSSTGWVGSAPDRPVGPRRSPFGEGDIGASPQLATFASVEDAPIRPRPPLSRALQPDGAFTLPSAFPFLNTTFVEGSAPTTGRSSRGPRLPDQWNLGPVFVALPWFDAPDGVTGRRPRAHGDDAWAPPPGSPWWGPQDADKPRNRRPLAPETAWDQPQAPFPLPFFQGAEAERSRQPRSPSTSTDQPWGSAILAPSTGWDTDPVVPIRWPRRPGSDVSAVGAALVFIPLAAFESNDPLPKYHRPGPGETAGPVGTFIVTLAASALDNQQAAPARYHRAPGEDGLAQAPLVSLLPFFDSAEVARMRAARRPQGVDGPVLFVPPALAEEPAVVRRRALRVVLADPEVLPPFVAPFSPAAWADLVRDPGPRPTRQGTRAPSWAEWPGPPFVPPTLGAWLDLSRDPTGRGTVVHPDHNSEWTFPGAAPTPPVERPATSLLLLGVQAQPARASQFSLTLRALLRDVEEDPHSRVVSGSRTFTGPEALLPQGGISAIRFLVVQPTAGSTLVLHLSSPSLGTASVPLRGPVVWRCAEGGAPLTRVSISGAGAARWALAGD